MELTKNKRQTSTMEGKHTHLTAWQLGLELAVKRSCLWAARAKNQTSSINQKLIDDREEGAAGITRISMEAPKQKGVKEE